MKTNCSLTLSVLNSVLLSVKKKSYKSLAVVVQAFSPRQREEDLHELEANLVYKASSRTARAVAQRNCFESWGGGV